MMRGTEGQSHLVERLQVTAVLAGEILLGQLDLELGVPVQFPLAAPQPGHLVCRQLPHVLLHPAGGQPGGGPAVAAPLHHLKCRDLLINCTINMITQVNHTIALWPAVITTNILAFAPSSLLYEEDYES